MSDWWWRGFLLKRLHDDPQFAAEYLEAAKESGDVVIYESAVLDIELARAGIWPGNMQANKDTSSR